MDITQEELISMVGMREVMLFAFRKQLAAERTAHEATKAELVIVRDRVVALERAVSQDYGEPGATSE